MTDLGVFGNVVEQAAAAAAASVERGAAEVGIVIGTPSQDMNGIQMAWEAMRAYFNAGAGVHHNTITSAADTLRRLG